MNNGEAKNEIEGFEQLELTIPLGSDTVPSDEDRFELLLAHQSESHKSSDPSNSSSNDLGTDLDKEYEEVEP